MLCFPIHTGIKHFCHCHKATLKESWEEHQAGAETGQVTRPKLRNYPKLVWCQKRLQQLSFYLVHLISAVKPGGPRGIATSPLKLSFPTKIMIHLSVQDLCPFLSCPCSPKNWRSSKKKQGSGRSGGGDKETKQDPWAFQRYKIPLCSLFSVCREKGVSFLSLPEFQRADSNSWGLEQQSHQTLDSS